MTLSNVNPEQFTPNILDIGSSAIKLGSVNNDSPKIIKRRTKYMDKADQLIKILNERSRWYHNYSFSDGHGLSSRDLLDQIAFNYKKDKSDRNNQEIFPDEIFTSPQFKTFKNNPILLTEKPFSSNKVKKIILEKSFEELKVSHFLTDYASSLALYNSGRITGISLHSGSSFTEIVGIYEGYTISNSVDRFRFGGDLVSINLQDLLTKNQNHTKKFLTQNSINHLKKSCYLSYNPNGPNQEFFSLPETFTLPDGSDTKITLQNEKFLAPEILFSNIFEGQGFAQIINEKINLAAIDLRKDLCRNVVLSGGNTNFKYLGNRVQYELEKLLIPSPNDDRMTRKNRKIQIYNCCNYGVDKIVEPWLGGKMIAQMSGFLKDSVSKAEYEEFGENLLFSHSCYKK